MKKIILAMFIILLTYSYGLAWNDTEWELNNINANIRNLNYTIQQQQQQQQLNQQRQNLQQSQQYLNNQIVNYVRQQQYNNAVNQQQAQQIQRTHSNTIVDTATIKCGECMSENEYSAKYCKKCSYIFGSREQGKALFVNTSQETQNLICKKCNNEIDKDSKFCKMCGQKISIEIVKKVDEEKITTKEIKYSPKTSKGSEMLKRLQKAK